MSARPFDLELPAEWKQVSGLVFARKLAILGACVAAGAFLATRAAWLPAALGTLVLGAMFAHAVELQHQCLHGTSVPSARGNRWLGMALGIPMFVSFTRYRRQHLHHHRAVGTAEDDAFFAYAERPEAMPLRRLLLQSFSLRRYQRVGRDVLHYVFGIGADVDGLPPAARRAARLDYAFAVGALVVATATLGVPLVLKLWLLPALLVAESVHFWVELPEHYGCASITRSSYLHTRTIAGSRLSFWLTNGNNFHLEHHLFQALPMERLPLVHERIRARIVNYDVSYLSFARDRIWRRELPGPTAEGAP